MLCCYAGSYAHGLVGLAVRVVGSSWWGVRCRRGEVPGSLPQARRVDRCNISGNGMSDAFESA